MNIEWSSSEEEGVVSESSRLHTFIHEGKKILWLLPGGSNIPIAVQVLKHLKEHVRTEDLAAITVTLTDERFGNVGHADSNWQQLTDAGFVWEGMNILPVLQDQPLEETVASWSKRIQEALRDVDVVLGHFGMGADGHIAGILPHTIAITDEQLVSSYETEQFTRITLSIKALQNVAVAYLFAYGETKEAPLHTLQEGALPLVDQPVHILRSLPEVHIYTDHVR